MSREAGAAPTMVSKRELESRVDERIRKFMAESEQGGLGARDDAGDRCMGSRAGARVSTSDVSQRMLELRQAMAEEEPLRRSEPVRSNAQVAREVKSRLCSLRRDVEESAEAAHQRMGRQPGVEPQRRRGALDLADF